MNTAWFQSLTNQLDIQKNTVTAIDHIITNSLLHSTINMGTITFNILDHFPIFLIAKTERRVTPEGNVQITKHLINNKTKEKIKNALQEMKWDDLINSKQTDSAYELSSINSLLFMRKFLKNLWLL